MDTNYYNKNISPSKYLTYLLEIFTDLRRTGEMLTNPRILFNGCSWGGGRWSVEGGHGSWLLLFGAPWHITRETCLLALTEVTELLLYNVIMLISGEAEGDTKGEKVTLKGAGEGRGHNEDRSPHRLQLSINMFFNIYQSLMPHWCWNDQSLTPGQGLLMMKWLMIND